MAYPYDRRVPYAIDYPGPPSYRYNDPQGYPRGSLPKLPPPNPGRVRYWPFRITGMIHIFLAVFLFAISVSLAALYGKDLQSGTISGAALFALGIYGFTYAIASAIFITILALATGIIGVMYTSKRPNLQAYHNSYMVLNVMIFCLCGSLFVYESIVHSIVYRNTPRSGSDAYSIYSLWIVLIAINAMQTVIAGFAASFTFCLMGCCRPIVNDARPFDTRSYTERELMPPLVGQDDPYIERYPKSYRY